MKWITGLVFVSLTGCVAVPEKKEVPLAQMVVEESVEKEADTTTAISPEVLYLLMTAEIAGQRNMYGVALDGYLQAAKKVKDPKVAERATKIGLFVKDTEKTDEAVSLWLEQDDGNLTARKIAVISSLRGTDKVSAVNHLETLLKDDPAGFEPTLLEFARILEKEGNTEFVFDVLDELSARHPDQAIVHFVQSLIAGQHKNKTLAEKKVNQALSLQPGWNKALILRAQYAAQNGKYSLARVDLEKVLQKTPDNERVKKMLAQVLVKMEAYDDAVSVYQSIIKSSPDDGDAIFSIALLYLQKKNEEKAGIYLNKLVNNLKWDGAASFYLGRIEFNKKNYDLALVWFDKVTRGGYVYDASMAAVSVLLNQKNYTEAEQRIEKITKNFPKRWLSTLMLKVEIYNVQKQYQKAFDIVSGALVERPEHRELLYSRALLAEKVDKLDVLETDLKAILTKNPDDANALNALGYTLADRTERYEEAEAYLSKAIKLKPDEAVIMDSVGWLRYKQGKFSEALKHLWNAYRKRAEGEIAAHLTEVLWMSGAKLEARKVFDKAFSALPENEYLLKVRQLMGVE